MSSKTLQFLNYRNTTIFILHVPCLFHSSISQFVPPIVRTNSEVENQVLGVKHLLRNRLWTRQEQRHHMGNTAMCVMMAAGLCNAGEPGAFGGNWSRRDTHKWETYMPSIDHIVFPTGYRKEQKLWTICSELSPTNSSWKVCSFSISPVCFFKVKAPTIKIKQYSKYNSI
jgi:hypothetical protein